jgi:hypothetical protein
VFISAGLVSALVRAVGASSPASPKVSLYYPYQTYLVI